MEKKELELLEKLAPTHPDVKALWDDHILFNKQLEKLEGKSYLTPDEQTQMRQLKKQKGKVAVRHSARGPSAPEPSADGKPSVDQAKKASANVSMDEASLYAPKVEHVHSFYARSLSIEEAIKEMESAGHDFYAFFNEDRRRVNVVFKRKKGYGLIDPRLED